MLEKYFRSLYRRTMHEAYSLARHAVADALQDGGTVLDCGAAEGGEFDLLNQSTQLAADRYFGLEWFAEAVRIGHEKGLNIQQGDLNKSIEFDNEQFECIFGYSVLEHLLNPCQFLRESHRCLAPGGSLVLLTPNISTFFTIALLLAGKMPSSGPAFTV